MVRNATLKFYDYTHESPIAIKAILYQVQKQIVFVLNFKNVNYTFYNGTTEGWCRGSKNCIECKWRAAEKKKTWT